jgi:hypothetical protein
MVRPERFELPTPWFEAKCSIQLSYGRMSTILSLQSFPAEDSSRLLPCIVVRLVQKHIECFWKHTQAHPTELRAR